MTVYGYVRVSTDKQADNSSMSTQRRQIRGTAEANDLDRDDITWLEDPGVSGAKEFFKRPAIAPKVFVNGDVVIVAGLDRFSRDPRDCLNTIHFFKERHVRLIINGHGEVTDESNIYGKLMIEIMVAFAGFERAKIRERNLAGQAACKRDGRYAGGPVPWGQRVDENNYLHDAITKEMVPDCNWYNATPRTFIIHRMAGERKYGESLRNVQKWILLKYPKLPYISHTTLQKLTDEYERKPVSGMAKKVRKKPLRLRDRRPNLPSGHVAERALRGREQRRKETLST